MDIAYIGSTATYRVGSWIRTDNGTMYRVCGEAVKTDRTVCVYDIPVDVSTARKPEEVSK